MRAQNEDRYIEPPRGINGWLDAEGKLRSFSLLSLRQKHRAAILAARVAAMNDRSDPFAGNRAYSQIMSGCAVPDDFSKGSRA